LATNLLMHYSYALRIIPHLKMFFNPSRDYLQEIKTVKELE